MRQLLGWAVVMTGRGDRIVFDHEFEVYRIRTAAGALLGTEYGGYPLGFDTRTQADEMVERRAEMAEYLRWLREYRGRAA
jgi:hypothetical protein